MHKLCTVCNHKMPYGAPYCARCEGGYSSRRLINGKQDPEKTYEHHCQYCDTVVIRSKSTGIFTCANCTHKRKYEYNKRLLSLRKIKG